MNPFAKSAAPIDPEIRNAVHQAIASAAEQDAFIHRESKKPNPATMTDDEIMAELQETVAEESEFTKLSKLVEDDFPFDESQLGAVNGMVSQRYACLTGAAGTGKTTVTKKLVDTLLTTTSLEGKAGMVDMRGYFKSDYQPEDEDDDYESERDWVPSVCIVGFTGRSTQAIKRNFPRDWHGNIMTIHRMLAFVPEYYDDFNENNALIRKMRFVPSYTADNKLPWDIIIIDEAGMNPVELWHQIWAAAKEGCRVYMIGDINQLPPVHGRSAFGFAMAKWPTWELTHVHRQKGKNNPIVDNAWRVLNGQTPVSEGNFQMMPLKGDAQMASKIVRASVPKMMEMGIYSPNRDTIITPTNGEDGSRGFALGQLPLNRAFALIFNPSTQNPRYIIDGGREKKQFAVGDKVMATKNDHERGITNGMTGIIVSIARNEAYAGEWQRFGTTEEVNEYLREEHVDDSHVEFSLEDLNDSVAAVAEGMKNKKEKAERGPASHIVTVHFGDEEHGFELAFGSLSEVGSLMTAYVVTCHKMQGGESPTIIIILHDAHKAMLYREWLYTAITRASQRCILLYTPDALRTTLNKQSIKGKTLQEKVKAFNELQDKGGIFGAAVTVNLPDAESIKGADVDLSGAIKTMDSGPTVTGMPIGQIVIKKLVINTTPPEAIQDTQKGDAQKPNPFSAPSQTRTIEIAAPKPNIKSFTVSRPTIPTRRLVSQRGAVDMLMRISQPHPKLLTHQPKVEEKPVPTAKVNPFAFIVANKKA